MLEGHDSPSSHRALVVVATAKPEPHAYASVPRPAPFITQLIASARRLPQARDRRRADASEVIAAYQDTVQRIRNLNAVRRA